MIINYEALAEGMISASKGKSILESYFENDFLSFVNESASAADIKHQCELIEARIKSEKITKDDFKKLEDMIKNSDDEISYDPYSLLLSIYGLVIYSCGASLASISIPLAISEMTIGYSYYLAGLVGYAASAKKVKVSISRFNQFYDSLMKKEAKAKVELKKAEALDDGKEKELKTKVYKNLIKTSDEFRKNYKKIIKNLENKDKEKTNDYSGKFAESVIMNESGEVEIVSEMKGNDFKNELFIQIMEDANEYFDEKFEYLKKLDQSITKIISSGKSITNSNIGQYIVSFRKIGRELNMMKDRSETAQKHVMDSLHANLAKFNNKYSEIGIAEKDKLYSKLEQMSKAIDDIIKKYDSEKGSLNKSLIDLFDAIEANVGSENKDKIKDLKDLVDSWVNGVSKTSEHMLKEVNKIANKVCNKAIKKSFVYKITNFKTYRAEKKAEKQEAKEKIQQYKDERKEIKQSEKDFRKEIKAAKKEDKAARNN